MEVTGGYKSLSKPALGTARVKLTGVNLRSSLWPVPVSKNCNNLASKSSFAFQEVLGTKELLGHLGASSIFLQLQWSSPPSDTDINLASSAFLQPPHWGQEGEAVIRSPTTCLSPMTQPSRDGTTKIHQVLCVPCLSHWSSIFCHSHSLPKDLAQGTERPYEDTQNTHSWYAWGTHVSSGFVGTWSLYSLVDPLREKFFENYKYKFRGKSAYLEWEKKSQKCAGTSEIQVISFSL